MAVLQHRFHGYVRMHIPLLPRVWDVKTGETKSTENFKHSVLAAAMAEQTVVVSSGNVTRFVLRLV